MTVLTATVENRPEYDQARELRALVARRSAAPRGAVDPAGTLRSLAVVSGKGGVGKSVVALNLALALAARDGSAALLDVSPGTGSLGLLCGQNGYWNMEHVLSGARRLDDVLLAAGRGVSIVPGAGHLLGGTAPSPLLTRELIQFERRHDWLVVDTGADLPQARRFASAADCTLIVTTPEPTAVAEAYAAMKTLAATGVNRVSVLVNQADTPRQADQVLDRLRHAARAFLGSDIGLAGFIPCDAAVGQSVFRRTPLHLVAPDCAAQRALDQIGQRLAATVPARSESTYIERLRGS